MTENELSKRIYEYLTESFKENKELIAAYIVNLGRKYDASATDSFKLQKTLLDYTMDISQIICIAMSKLLFEAGVLNIQSEDD